MKRKRFKLLLLWILFLGIIICCARVDYYVKPGVNFSRFHRAAVLPLTSPPGTSKEEGSGLSEGVADIVATQLLKKGWDVVERTRIKHIFDERSLELTQIPGGKHLEEVRNILGVDCFVTGAITEWRKQALGYDGAVGLTIKIYDSRTGELVWSGSGSRGVGLFDEKSLSWHARDIVTSLSKKIPSR